MPRRIYVALTPGQLAAIDEALSERAAGCPEDSGGLPASRYDDAAMAMARGVAAEVAVFFTLAQAVALQSTISFSHGNAEGDETFQRLFRGPAAERANDALDAAVAKARRPS